MNAREPERVSGGIENANAALAVALEAAAEVLDPPPTVRTTDGVTTWSVADQPIVSLSAASAAFRVGPEIGAAARNTPDAGDSPLGREWVAFSPSSLEGHAVDRLTAWFAAAYRRARSTTR